MSSHPSMFESGQAARSYHDRSKWRFVVGPDGSEQIMAGTPPDLHPALGVQDPDDDPGLFEVYVGVDAIETGDRPIESELDALVALTASGDRPSAPVTPDLATLGRLLRRSNGILKTWTSPWGKEIQYRAAGQTGARFHLELYLVTGDVPGLPAGVYHYGAHDNRLYRLRSGDYRGWLTDAAGGEPAVAAAPAMLIVTSQVWRNAWRYLDHSFRHIFWDMGTMLTNTLALAASAAVPAEVVFGYADEMIERLLGVDGRTELVAGLVALGRGAAAASSPVSIEPVDVSSEPPTADWPVFPVIDAAYRGTGLPSPEAVRDWRSSVVARLPLAATQPPGTPARALDPMGESGRTIEDVIERRRSNRHYQASVPVSFADLSTVLAAAAAPPRLDVPFPASDVYLIVNNVEGLVPGSYLYDRAAHAVHLLRAGDLRADAERLAMGQHYAAEAHVVAFGMADLDAIGRVYGDRGYRLALFEAALFGGRMQLAAHALGLGAVGSGSPDDEVTTFFSPHAAGKDYLFVAVFGVKRRPTAEELAAATRFLNRDRS